MPLMPAAQLARPAAPPMPVPGAGGPPGQPPLGSSPITQPSPNAGFKAAALSKVQLAVRILEKALPEMGVASEEGKDIMKALSTLAKHIPAGAASPGIENSTMMQMMLQGRQEAPMLQLAQQRPPMSGGAPGGGAQPAPGGPAPAPMAA